MTGFGREATEAAAKWIYERYCTSTAPWESVPHLFRPAWMRAGAGVLRVAMQTEHPCPEPNCNEGLAGPDDQRCPTCDGEGFLHEPVDALRAVLRAMVDLYRHPDNGRLLVEPGASPLDDALAAATAALGWTPDGLVVCGCGELLHPDEAPSDADGRTLCSECAFERLATELEGQQP